MMRLIDADKLQIAIVEKGQADERHKYKIGEFWELNGAEIRETINKQPTIEAAPVRCGRWIKTDKHDIYYQPGYKCSVCEILTTCHGNYCPNCGAKMEKNNE